VNRIARIREWGPDLFGRAQNRWRVIRTSNAYTFVDPQKGAETSRFSSKSDHSDWNRWFKSFISWHRSRWTRRTASIKPSRDGVRQ
jgi:hypothetical protein